MVIGLVSDLAFAIPKKHFVHNNFSYLTSFLTFQKNNNNNIKKHIITKFEKKFNF